MKTKICPGVPPGAPPSIQEYEDTSLPDKDSRKRKIRSVFSLKVEKLEHEFIK